MGLQPSHPELGYTVSKKQCQTCASMVLKVSAAAGFGQAAASNVMLASSILQQCQDMLPHEAGVECRLLHPNRVGPAYVDPS